MKSYIEEIKEMYDLKDYEREFFNPECKKDEHLYIFGSSGSGKSTYLRNNFAEYIEMDFDKDKAIIDVLAENHELDEAMKMLQGSFLNSIPTWLTSYNNLSNGEKMRFELLWKFTNKEIVVIDEFTSTLDRVTAFNMVNNIIKMMETKTFIFCSCHNDLISALPVKNIIDMDSRTMQTNVNLDMRFVDMHLINNPHEVLEEGVYELRIGR